MTARREPLSDIDLTNRAREGDREAFAELWRRHSAAGYAIARSVTASIDPDDLVAEAYGKIYALVKRGGGPTGAFRPYLAATIRNVAIRAAKDREIPIDFADDLVDDSTSDAAGMRQLDRDLVLTAFKSLPDRWQQALWYSEVEDMSLKECADVFGLKPTAAAMLTFRAREGLRDAWIQAHVRSIESGTEHEWVVERLGAYSRERLTKRESARLRAHLSDCQACESVENEARTVASRLAVCVLPTILGIGAALAYLAQVSDGATAASAAGLAAFARSTVLQKGLHQVQVVVGSSAIVTLALASGISVSDLAQQPVPSHTGADARPSEPAGISSPKKDGLSIDADLGEDGVFYPVLSGTAQPNSLVQISANGRVVAETPAGESGTWKTEQIEAVSRGRLSVAILSHGVVTASGWIDVELPVPELSVRPSAEKVAITVHGIAGAGIVVAAQTQTTPISIAAAVLDRSGTWSGTFSSLPEYDSLTVRYGIGQRFGPASEEPR